MENLQIYEGLPNKDRKPRQLKINPRRVLRKVVLSTKAQLHGCSETASPLLATVGKVHPTLLHLTFTSPFLQLESQHVPHNVAETERKRKYGYCYR